MNDLAKIPEQQIAKTVSDECSPELWRLLTDHRRGHFEMVEDLIKNDIARTEIRAISDRMEAHLTPCGKEVVVEILAPLVAVYGVPDRSKGEWSAFWRIYIEALSDLPTEVLRAGVTAYVNRGTSEFFPKPGPLKQLCLDNGGGLYMAVGRVRSVMRRIAA